MPITFATSQVGAPANYSKYLWGQLSKTDKLNDPDVLDFSLAPVDSSFVKLIRGTYVTVTTQLYGVWFTGYITNDPELEYLGTNNGTPIWGYKYQAIGDEYILNLQPLRVQQSFFNTTQGQILRTLVGQLCPGLFNTTGIQDGLVIAEYDIQNEMHFSDIVKEFGDMSYFVLRSKNRVMTWASLTDVAATIAVDGHDKHFTPSRLKISQAKEAIINDATVMGDVEAQAHISEYWVGDGATGKMPLVSSVYGLVQSFLIDDSFSGTQIDTTQWLQNGAFFDTWVQLSNGFLNVLGGNSTFDVSLQSVNLIPLEGHFRMTMGDFDFVSSSQGLLGGLWTAIPSSDFTKCLYSLKLNGLTLNPIVNGVVDSTQSITINTAHRYVFRTIVNFARATRVDHAYGYINSSGAVASYGGSTTPDTVSYSTIIVEIDPNTGNIVQPLPNVNYTTWTNENISMSGSTVFAYYVPFVASDLHLTMTGVTVDFPLQASLEEMTKNTVGSGTTVAPGPILVSHSNITSDTADTNLVVYPFSLAIDTSNTAYVAQANTSGPGYTVYTFNSSGTLLGTLGVFNILPEHMKVWYHPTNGTWLVANDAPIWGENFQAICISGGPGTGTTTAVVGTQDGGLSSGGNNGAWDVDTNGNLWQFGTDFSNPIPTLKQLTLSGSTLTVSNTTNLTTLYGWTGGSNGCVFNTVDGNLYLAGVNGSSHGILAKINPSTLAIISSTTSTSNIYLGYNVGSDGKCVVFADVGASANVITLTSLTTASFPVTDWGLGVGSHQLYGWYDGVHTKAWMHTQDGHCNIIDFNNATPTGLAILKDVHNPNTDKYNVLSSPGGPVCVSPDGSFAVTVFRDSSNGFIDFWR